MWCRAAVPWIRAGSGAKPSSFGLIYRVLLFSARVRSQNGAQWAQLLINFWWGINGPIGYEKRVLGGKQAKVYVHFLSL